MPVVLALLYVLCHGLVLALWPGPAGAGSFVFLTGAPLLAAIACLWRARRDRAALGWRATALALLLWAGGMAFNMIDALGAGRADFTRAQACSFTCFTVCPWCSSWPGAPGTGQHQPDRCGDGGAVGRAVLRARAVVCRPR